MLASPMRRCTNCGAEQERLTETRWMRVTGYRWLPLVGRCKGPNPMTSKLTKADVKLTDRQYGLLKSFCECHDEGLKSPPYYEPFGIGRLQLGGEGQALVGMIKRGLISERNNIFYVTPLGLSVRTHLQKEASK